VKYFSTTKEGARQYADMAEKAFGDPAYTIVETEIPTSSIAPEMAIEVDRGISTVTVPTEMLNELAPPNFVD